MSCKPRLRRLRTWCHWRSASPRCGRGYSRAQAGRGDTLVRSRGASQSDAHEGSGRGDSASLECGAALYQPAATLVFAVAVQALAVDVVTLALRVPEMRTLARDARAATLALGCDTGASLARDAGTATLALGGVVQALAVDLATLVLGKPEMRPPRLSRSTVSCKPRLRRLRTWCHWRSANLGCGRRATRTRAACARGDTRPRARRCRASHG